MTGTALRSPSPESLAAYIKRLTGRLRAAGVVIMHRADFDKPVTGAAALSMKNVVQEENPELLDALNGLGGFFIAHEKWDYILLPDVGGLVDRMAAHAGIDAGKIRAGGITDFDIYALLFLHEASHAFGKTTNFVHTGNFTYDETATYIRHTARYLNHGGKPEAARLFNAFCNASNLTASFDRHGWSHYAAAAIASEWIMTRHNSSVWNKQIDGLRAWHAIDIDAMTLRNAGDALRAETGHGPDAFIFARPEPRAGLATACFTAAAKLTGMARYDASGYHYTSKAALPLRILGRSLRVLQSYDPV